MSSRNIYIPTPCQVLAMTWWGYEPPSEQELMEGASRTNIGWPQYGEKNGMYGRKQSEKQKAAAAEAASRTFKGVPKWYKTHTPIMKGSDNPRARKIYAEGKEYDTIKECCDAYGFKNHNAIRYRLNHPKWTEWYYL